jgi:hypothetical protein
MGWYQRLHRLCHLSVQLSSELAVQPKFDLNKMVKTIKHTIESWDKLTTAATCILTLTTSFAASSAGKPRHACAAISEDTASHIPSEAIISLPPAFESYDNPKHTY